MTDSEETSSAWLTENLIDEIASKALAPLQDDNRYEQHETPADHVKTVVVIVFEVLGASGYSVVKLAKQGQLATTASKSANAVDLAEIEARVTDVTKVAMSLAEIVAQLRKG